MRLARSGARNLSVPRGKCVSPCNLILSRFSALLWRELIGAGVGDAFQRLRSLLSRSYFPDGYVIYGVATKFAFEYG